MYFNVFVFDALKMFTNMKNIKFVGRSYLINLEAKIFMPTTAVTFVLKNFEDFKFLVLKVTAVPSINFRVLTIMKNFFIIPRRISW
jgi:hypothetical protein